MKRFFNQLSSVRGIEMLSMLVIATSAVAMIPNSGKFVVSAASFANSILSLVGGESILVACNGSSLTLTKSSNTTGTLGCIGLAPVVTPIPTNIPAQTVVTLGSAAVGNILDGDDSNYLTGTKFTNGSRSFQASKGYVYTGPVDANSSRRSFQVGVYSDNNGKPATLLGQSAVGTLGGPETWSSVNFTSPVSMAANTTYWLVYNTNGGSSVSNNLYYSKNGVGAYSSNNVNFGSWPSSFPATTMTDYVFSIYVSNGGTGTGGTNPVPTLGSDGGNPTPTVAMPPMGGGTGSDSMAMMAWRVGGKNAPNSRYDKCDDGTDVVKAHNMYSVSAYDGFNYPTWHPPVVTNPVTGNGKCYFGHEHGTNPQGYQYWDEIVQHFGRDMNGDGKITAMTIGNDGRITTNDRAGLPFGIGNEHMDKYYNQEGRDSIFVRHEDHVGHKVEFVNGEADMIGNTTHVMGNNTTGGVNIPYYKGDDTNTYYPTGVLCTHLHKFHQGTHSADALRNNMHEVIFHSNCTSNRSVYPSNTVLLTGMMTFGNPSEYVRFCGANRYTKVCVDGTNANGSCKVTDPLIAKLPDALYSDTLGRNMVDKYCLQNVEQLSGSFYFNPYEIWQGDLQISLPNGKMLAEHGRQWDVLDPIRYVDPASSTGFGYNSTQCGPGGLLYKRSLNCERNGEYVNTEWDSPASGFRGLKRTTYFGRNRISNQGGAQIWWSDPLGGNASTSQFASGLKQKISSVEADINQLPESSKLNDRAIQRLFNSGGDTVHAPN